MARRARIQPDNVCFHVMSRIAHQEFMFNDAEKDIVVRFIENAERFSGVTVLAYCIMSNHIHLCLAIDKPESLMAWERWQMLLHYDFDKFKDGQFYKISDLTSLSQEEVDEVRRCEKMSLFDRYELTRDELVERIRILLRPKAFEELMARWQQFNADELEREHERFFGRMYNLSEFMRTLKQNITQYYNARHKHTGSLWEARFKDVIAERSIETMSSIASYIDLNPWRSKMIDDPRDYKWNSFAAAIAGDESRRAGYNLIYDTSDAWATVENVHAQQLKNRMEKDDLKSAEIEEAVFTSNGIVGSESFIDSIVSSEDGAFPFGHKTPPSLLRIAGGAVLYSLRRLKVMR